MRELLFKVLLSPFSLLYGIVISIRNGFYKYGILKSARFNVPVIGVGNLTLGGAGKTPHVEYLIRLLSPYLTVGTLSRGYKRKTKGFRMVSRRDNSETVGDEPLQYHLKYPQVRVAVSESRSIGIPMLLSNYPEVKAILLDDSYQHLSVTPGLNVLLTEFSAPYTNDVLLPAGRLREWKSGADRADIVVVTKCPDHLEPQEKKKIKDLLKLKANQKLFFSKYIYGHPYFLLNGQQRPLQKTDQIILISAIANESYLLQYLERQVQDVFTMTYEDHHYYSAHEISVLQQQYEHLGADRTIIVTTEKDATRLILHRDFMVKKRLPIYVLPVKVSFLGDGEQFDQEIKSFLMEFQA